MSKEKEVDDLFKKGLADPAGSSAHMDDDWDALEQMLDEGKKRRGFVYWLPVLSSVAALMLLFLGWWAFKPKAVTNGQTIVKVSTENHQQTNTGTSGGSTRQQPAQQQANQLALISPGKQATAGNKQQTRLLRSEVAGARRGLTGIPVADTLIPPGRGISRVSAETLVAMNNAQVNYVDTVVVQHINIAAIPGSTAIAAANTQAAKPSKIKAKAVNAFHPQYTLSVLAAPDLNGVGSFQQSKVGTNEGLLFSATVSKKLTISTGAIYSAKPYITGFENYHTPYVFSTDPVNVTADCKMFDIPLNVSYMVYNKHQSKISFGTGLSSYIMLHQDFQFNYADPYTPGPVSYTARNNGSYFFGVVNLNATYQRQLNSKIGISFQPYLKLPLTNIGYSQVRLQTTGVAVGLNWNLNSLARQ